MPPNRYAYLYRKKIRVSKKPKSSKKPKTSKTFTKKVKSIISRTLETKTRYISTDAYTTIGFTDSATVPTARLDMTPTMQKGTSDGNRIGDDITVSNYYLNIYVQTSMAANTNRIPYIVDIYIAYIKGDPNNMPSTTTQFNNMFYSNVVGTYNTSVSNDPQSFLAPICTDYWTILWHRRNIGICEPSNAGTQYSTHDGDYHSRRHFKINATKFLPKTLKFQDNFSSGQYPTNTHGPYVIAFVRTATSSTVTPLGNEPSIYVNGILKYKDA